VLILVPMAQNRRPVQEAVDVLPRPYVLVLRGALAGFSDRELAALVDVPVESVRPMVRLAAAKFVSALAEPGREPS
jgi:DNA-directed RNA polymerase specialized sigma24 family protein